MNTKVLAIVAIIAVIMVVSSQQFSFIKESSEDTIADQVATDLPNEASNEQTFVPSISYQTILENDEFKSGMQLAVKNSDIEAAKTLQLKAVEIAIAAGLPASQINLLSGDSGLNFMQFLAKRQLFSIAFEKRYRELKGIQDLKLIYPEAKDLFEKSDALIAQRDQQIREIAQELAEGNDLDAYLQQAQAQWLTLNKSME